MNDNDEDFNYDRQYKKMCTGLGVFLSKAQQNSCFEESPLECGNTSVTSIQYSANELSTRKKR